MPFIPRESSSAASAPNRGRHPHRGRRRRHRDQRQDGRGRRRRHGDHLQLRPLPDGGARVAGGLLAYGDANAIVVEMAAEVLPVVRDMAVLAGINGTDPFRIMRVFLRQLREIGFDGVQNFPTVGLIDGDFRRNLEATGMGYDKEIAAIAECPRPGHVHLALRVRPRPGAGDGGGGRGPAGRHVGLTTAGTIGAGVAFTLDEAIERVMAMAEAGAVRPDVIVLCHGGPFDEPAQVGEALPRMPGIHGFFGASSVERLPTERAIRGQVQEFKQLGVARA